MTRQLETKTARFKLAPRKKPYFVAVTPGVSLGYRRNKTAGAWLVRAADGHGGNWMKGFGVADDFESSNGKTILTFAEAQDRARTLARGGNNEKGSSDRPTTVSEAADNYEADLRARGANAYNVADAGFAHFAEGYFFGVTSRDDGSNVAEKLISADIVGQQL